MASLYSISNELQDIIFQLEEGKVTDELIEKLAITEDGLKDKIKNYIDVIKHYQAQESECKNEKDRINKIQKIKTNTYTRLKNVVLDAVLAYGTIGKSGNRVIEGATYKVYSKNTTTVKLDEFLIADVIRLYMDIAGEYISSTDNIEELDLDYLANIITKNLQAERKRINEESYSFTGEENNDIRITKDDLDIINVEYSINISLADLCSIENLPLLSWIRQHPHKTNVFQNISSSIVKEHLKLGANLNICKEETNTSLIIK